MLLRIPLTAELSQNSLPDIKPGRESNPHSPFINRPRMQRSQSGPESGEAVCGPGQVDGADHGHGVPEDDGDEQRPLHTLGLQHYLQQVPARRDGVTSPVGA